MEEIVKHYTNGEVTVVWKPKRCTHATHCFSDLPEVFIPWKRPWVDPHAASTDKIIDQVKQCPSGALSYFMNNNNSEEMENTPSTPNVVKVTPITDGPLLVEGSCSLADKDGNITEHGPATYLCRCGGSANKPFCDGTHRKIEFKG